MHFMQKLDEICVCMKNLTWFFSFPPEPDLKKRIRVHLLNAHGLDEAGIDGGGIFREFLNELLKSGFNPNQGFFKTTNEGLLYPNPAAQMLVGDSYARHYYFLGRMLGKVKIPACLRIGCIWKEVGTNWEIFKECFQKLRLKSCNTFLGVILIEQSGTDFWVAMHRVEVWEHLEEEQELGIDRGGFFGNK